MCGGVFFLKINYAISSQFHYVLVFCIVSFFLSLCLTIFYYFLFECTVQCVFVRQLLLIFLLWNEHDELIWIHLWKWPNEVLLFAVFKNTEKGRSGYGAAIAHYEVWSWFSGSRIEILVDVPVVVYLSSQTERNCQTE